MFSGETDYKSFSSLIYSVLLVYIIDTSITTTQPQGLSECKDVLMLKFLLILFLCVCIDFLLIQLR